MKFTDDRAAKFRIWAREAKVVSLPAPVPLPPFGVQRFKTHDEMNAWKESLLRAIAREAADKLRGTWRS